MKLARYENGKVRWLLNLEPACGMQFSFTVAGQCSVAFIISQQSHYERHDFVVKITHFSQI